MVSSNQTYLNDKEKKKHSDINYHNNEIEIRNKTIHIYQTVLMLESGRYNQETGFNIIKSSAKSIITLLDKV